MTRNEYLQLRATNAHTEILYKFALEKGLRNIDFYSFTTYLLMWSQRIGPLVMTEYQEKVLFYYDSKFSIVFTNKFEKHKILDPETGEIKEIERLITIKIL